MKAYVLEKGSRRARLLDIDSPSPGPSELLLDVEACGLCRTDLHLLDGDLAIGPDRVVLGHQVVGRVVAVGEGVDAAWVGQRCGVPWLGGACGRCEACRKERENLCPNAELTGCSRDGGLAERMTARADYCLPLESALQSVQVAPLLCAGLIGYRAYRMAGPAQRIGIYGFGAAAHLLAQVLKFEGKEIFAFTRPGDLERQAYARSLGARWAGGSDEPPPELLDAAILFADRGELVPRALSAVTPGGTVVCGEIHMTDIPSFPYDLLWREKTLRSVANLTRRDGRELLALAARIPLVPDASAYPLSEVERAIADLRAGKVHGAAVVVPDFRNGAQRS